MSLPGRTKLIVALAGILVILLAIPAARLIGRIIEINNAIGEVEAAGGHGSFDRTVLGGPKEVFLSTSGIKSYLDDAQLAKLVPALGSLRGLRFLGLAETKISDASVAGLATLQQLQKIDVAHTEVSSKGALELCRRLRLESIVVAPGQLTPEDRDELLGDGIGVIISTRRTLAE